MHDAPAQKQQISCSYFWCHLPLIEFTNKPVGGASSTVSSLGAVRDGGRLGGRRGDEDGEGGRRVSPGGHGRAGFGLGGFGLERDFAVTEPGTERSHGKEAGD